MAGTVSGGRLAAKTNKEKYGDDFYKRMGSRGGANGKGPSYMGGFAARKKCECDLIKGVHIKSQCSGLKGGRISKRISKKGIINE